MTMPTRRRHHHRSGIRTAGACGGWTRPEDRSIAAVIFLCAAVAGAAWAALRGGKRVRLRHRRDFRHLVATGSRRCEHGIPPANAARDRRYRDGSLSFARSTEWPTARLAVERRRVAAPSAGTSTSAPPHLPRGRPFSVESASSNLPGDLTLVQVFPDSHTHTPVRRPGSGSPG
jgi:hypothetical protein